MTARKKYKKVIPDLFKEYIQGTESKSIVVNKTVFLCHLIKAVQENNNFDNSRVYIGSKVVKHLYDSKPVEEFDFIINHMHKFVKYPDYIYKNKPGKRGDFGFLKENYSLKTKQGLSAFFANGISIPMYYITIFKYFVNKK